MQMSGVSDCDPPPGGEENVQTDWRAEVARFYDLAPHHPDDFSFYAAQVPSPQASVLELGCGTGRVSLPLSEHCAFLCGLDSSRAMLERLVEKRGEAGIDEGRLRAQPADITEFALGRTFDLVIAPFRVMQNLETDQQVAGMLRGIGEHLAPGGRAILNAFNPNRDRAEMIASWPRPGESLAWEIEDGADLVRCFDHRITVQPDPLVVYPRLVYQRFRAGEQIDEATLDICMRCYYPDEFIDLIETAGFEVYERWGGYAGEVYGEGEELVVVFGHPQGTAQ